MRRPATPNPREQPDSAHRRLAARAAPLLVLVTGAPASGKTTLARCLADALGLPLLDKDTFKEILADTMGAPTRAESDKITAGAFGVFLLAVDRVLSAGVGVVAEANFHRGVAEPYLEPLVKKSRSVLVYCGAPSPVSVRRFIERFERGERHWSYFDGERIEQLHRGHPIDAWERGQPLDLDVLLLRVDTRDGYAPDLDVIVKLIRSVSRSQ